MVAFFQYTTCPRLRSRICWAIFSSTSSTPRRSFGGQTRWSWLRFALAIDRLRSFFHGTLISFRNFVKSCASIHYFMICTTKGENLNNTENALTKTYSSQHEPTLGPSLQVYRFLNPVNVFAVWIFFVDFRVYFFLFRLLDKIVSQVFPLSDALTLFIRRGVPSAEATDAEKSNSETVTRYRCHKTSFNC